MKDIRHPMVFVFALLVAACGDPAVPNVVIDASPIDAESCQCPVAQTLTEDLLVRAIEVENTNVGIGLGGRCDNAGDYVVAGGCSMSNAISNIHLFGAGYYEYMAQDFIVCDWNGDTAVNLQRADYSGQYFCLREDGITMQPEPAPEGCDCPPTEPLMSRLVREIRTQGLSANSDTHATASCRNGGVLIGGGCSLGSFGVDRSVALVQSGLGEDGASWQCSWNNPTVSSTVSVVASATCVQPPSPGMAEEAEPLEGRVVHVVHEEPIPANDLLAFTVSCDPGDALLMGSCALDNAEPPNHQVELFQNGLDPVSEDSNTWRCGWDNPSSATPTGIATAICLRPPSR